MVMLPTNHFGLLNVLVHRTQVSLNGVLIELHVSASVRISHLIIKRIWTESYVGLKMCIYLEEENVCPFDETSQL